MKSILNTLTCVLLVGVVQGHDKFESEIDETNRIDDQIASPTGKILEPYGVAFERNLPIYITAELFFNEILNPDRAIMHVDGIFLDPETNKMPNWFLMFSMPKCGHCVDVKPELHALATYFHDLNNADMNYRVAEIDCTNDAAADLCFYFGINKLPKFMVLRTETDWFYLYPSRDERTFHSFFNFAMNSYVDAFI